MIGLAYGQMTNNLTSQAATMQLNGVPNDLINNLDPLALIIFIPIINQCHLPPRDILDYLYIQNELPPHR